MTHSKMLLWGGNMAGTILVHREKWQKVEPESGNQYMKGFTQHLTK